MEENQMDQLKVDKYLATISRDSIETRSGGLHYGYAYE